MEEKIKGLVKRVNSLERKILLLSNRLGDHNFTVEELLKIRGIKSFHSTDINFIEETQRKAFYESMKNYHFRRILGDVLNYSKLMRDDISLISKKWGWNAEKYILTLAEEGILEKRDGDFLPKVSVSNSGLILQWYVALTIKAEINCDVAYDVRIDDFKNGGDIDILLSIGTNLVMFECKGSPPNNVSVSEMKSIISRKEIINPELFVFLLDTTLSVKRNILNNLEWILKKQPERIREGIYRFGTSDFVVTAKRDLAKNLLFLIKNFRTLK